MDETRRGAAEGPRAGSERERAGARPGVMPFGRYRPTQPIALPERRWPARVLTRAPRWCSVDLRDGNQALVEPMGLERKLRLFDTLVAIGFDEIEVAFPSASQTEFDFVRRLIDDQRIPDHVTLQVLTPCRPELIERTFEAIEGAPRTIVHFYNSTSPLQRRVVFGQDRAGIVALAVEAARLIRARAAALPDQTIRFEYSPESFTSTELEFALEIAEAVLDTLGASAASPVILNLPSTVEVATPNVYADQIEWIAGHLARREAVILSVHPHNDRGCAVAAAELACLAGADRVEGTLFGNGERTGNVDLVTLALNLMSQGVDPELDLRDLPALVRRVEAANRLPVHARHPYAGELVFTAFSGSHQDAIRKGLAALDRAGTAEWAVPYLPVDPADLGRDYEAVIRINSQSGKGGIAYRLETDAGYRIPRRMQIELSQSVQRWTDASGEELSSERLRTLFEREYLRHEAGPTVVGDRSLAASGEGGAQRLEVELQWEGVRHALTGVGPGPLDAFVAALSQLVGQPLRIGDYQEHVLGERGSATAVAYVELVFGPGRALYGAGVATSIVDASFAAVASALGRAVVREWIEVPTSAAATSEGRAPRAGRLREGRGGKRRGGT